MSEHDFWWIEYEMEDEEKREDESANKTLEI
jgi:hypothetical protein